jgi:hypothetical protein
MTWRTTAKTAAARLVCWTGGDRMVRALTGGAAPPLVVGYHRVVDDLEGAGRHAIPAMLTSRAMLEQHLDWIGRRHRFVTLDELGQRIEDGEPVSRLAAVTFDDGYRDLYEHAFPVLARKGIPAAAFVVTDLVGTTGLLIHDRLYVLLRRAFSRWRTPLRDLGALLGALDIWLAPPGLAGLSADARSALQLLLRRLPRWDVARIADALEERVGAEPDAAADMLPLTRARRSCRTRSRGRAGPSRRGFAPRSRTSRTRTAISIGGRSGPWPARAIGSPTPRAATGIRIGPR